MGGRQFRIDTYPSKTSSRPGPMAGLELEDFYALLEHEETDCIARDGTPGCEGKFCPQKDGLAWTAGFIDDPCCCGSSAAPNTKRRERAGRCPDCGKSIRYAANAAGLDFGVFDIDHISEQQRDEMLGNLDGVELYLHTTHNHLPPGDQNFRLVFPFSRTITPDEWKQIWFVIVRKFSLPEAPKHGVDKSTRDPVRLAFFPRALRGRPYLNLRQEGPLLDPGSLLQENLRHSRTQLAATPLAPRADPGSVDLGDLKGFLRRYSPSDDLAEEKKEIIRLVLDEEPLATKGSRGFTTLRAGAIVGKLLPLGTPVEAALEILRPAISKIEILDGDDPDESSVEAWLNQVRRGFESAQEDKEQEAIETNDVSGKLLALARRKREAANPGSTRDRPPLSQYAPPTASDRPPTASDRPHTPPIGPPNLPRPSVPAHFPVPPSPDVAEDDDPDGAWRNEKMILTVDKQGVPHPKNTFSNVVAVLENHRAWKGVLKYNALTNEPEAHGGPILAAKRDPDRLIIATRVWMTQKEELDFPRGEIADAVEFVAREEAYDPVREYLLGLRHDGKSRSGNWLIDYCGARLKDDSGLDVSTYVRLVGEKWLMAAVARVLYPGCQADNVLVLEGQQFAGKSSALNILGGEWFAAMTSELGNLTTHEITVKNWIIEMPELSTMKKSETEKQKAFFSNRADNFRFSYARRVKQYERRCVFAGTTNETQYLIDLTGNRRFWCVWCDLFDLIALERDRDQLWAEVVAKVLAGETCPNCHGVDKRCPEHRWWLDREQTSFAEMVSKTRLKSEFSDEIRAWWFSRGEKPPYLLMKTILVDILGLTLERKEQHQQAIGRAMVRLGFERHQVPVPGGRAWAYVPSEAFRLAPPSGKVAFNREATLVQIAEATAPKDKQ